MGETNDARPILADLVVLKIEGPAVVFIRPRNPLQLDLAAAVRNQLHELSRLSKLGTFVLVPHDFEIMAVGDADLARYGLTRLPGVPSS